MIMATDKARNAEMEKKFDILAKMGMGDKGLPLFAEKDYVQNAGVIPTGSISLDMAIGGGYPRGSIVNAFGPESSGKSLLSILAIAQVQKMGGMAVIWDAEHSYSKNSTWMRVNGVDTSKLIFLKLKPEEGCEVGFDAVEKIIKSGAADLIVIDSVPYLIPQESLDKAMTDGEQMARRAGILTRALPRLSGFCDESKTVLFLIDQIRANIVTGPAAAFAPKTKETTSLAAKHACAMRLKVEKITKSEIRNNLPYSHKVQVTAVKNKVAIPYRTAIFDLVYTKGVDTVAEVADILMGANIAEKKGAWVVYGTEKYNGRDAFIESLRDPKNYEKAFKKAMSLSDSVNVFGAKGADKEGEISISAEEESK